MLSNATGEPFGETFAPECLYDEVNEEAKIALQHRDVAAHRRLKVINSIIAILRPMTRRYPLHELRNRKPE
jgi:hypothetical protein